MIKIENLSFSYGRNTVLKGITLNLEPGRIYGLLGENGVGKTTLLTLLSGLKKPKEGYIRIGGGLSCNDSAVIRNEKGRIVSSAGIDPYRRDPEYLEELMYIPDEVVPVPLKAETWAREYGAFRKHFTMERFREIMSLMDVDIEQKMSSMSNGQLKKTYIAFALASKPRYIYMDEPTNGLDIPSKSTFRSALLKYTPEESIVIIATHQVRDLENIIDPIIILDRNEVLLNASIETITKELFFDYGSVRKENALWCEPTPEGLIQVVVNSEGLDSKVNIEALFNTVDKNKETIKSIFSHE